MLLRLAARLSRKRHERSSGRFLHISSLQHLCIIALSLQMLASTQLAADHVFSTPNPVKETRNSRLFQTKSGNEAVVSSSQLHKLRGYKSGRLSSSSTEPRQVMRSSQQHVMPNDDGDDQDGVESYFQPGSRPPKCESKCNKCRPCQAVQVPATPTHDRGPSSPNHTSAHQQHPITNTPNRNPNPNDQFTHPQANYTDQYSSNYKPEDWKCRCGNMLFNP